jgi:chromosome segregation ATPase
MVQYLTVNNIISPNFSTPLSSLSFPQTQGKESLKQKLENLRHRMSSACKVIETIQQEQKEMRQQVVMIQKDQEEIEKKQIVVHQKQENIQQNFLVIQNDQSSIRLILSRMTLKWKEIFKQAIHLQQDHKALQLKLEGVELRRGEILQQAMRVRQNQAAIRQDVQVAAQIGHYLQETALIIQQQQAVMELQIKEITDKRDDIQQNIPLAQLPLGIIRSIPLQMAPLNALTEKKIADFTSQMTTGFWANLLKKIVECLVSTFATFANYWTTAQLLIKKHVESHEWSWMKDAFLCQIFVS